MDTPSWHHSRVEINNLSPKMAQNRVCRVDTILQGLPKSALQTKVARASVDARLLCFQAVSERYRDDVLEVATLAGLLGQNGGAAMLH